MPESRLRHPTRKPDHRCDSLAMRLQGEESLAYQDPRCRMTEVYQMKAERGIRQDEMVNL